MKIRTLISDNFSIFDAPTKLKKGDTVIVIVFSIIAIMLVPMEVTHNISLGDIAIIFLLCLVSFLIVCFFKKNISSMLPYYIRALWALIGGIVSFIVAMIFRQESFLLPLIVISFSLGQIVGFQIYRSIRQNVG